MGRPTISYGHKVTRNCNSTTGWVETRSGMTDPQTAFIVENNAYFKLTGTCDDVGDEYFYQELDLTNFDSDDYPRFAFRWKTGGASNGLGARVKLIFTSGTQWILGESAPEFSTTWKVTTGAITAGKEVDKIQIWADDDPNTVAAGSHDVYFQWILLYAEDWPFPYLSEPIQLQNRNREAVLQIPGRVGDVVQYMGMDSPLVTLKGEMDDTSDWGQNPIGYKLYDIHFSRDDTPWRWFTSNIGSFRVEPVSFEIAETSERGAKRSFEMVLRKLDEYGASGLWVGEYYWPTT